MNNEKKKQGKPQPQTTGNPARESLNNPLTSTQTTRQNTNRDIEELEKEQQFKEAQTERD